MWLSKSKQPVNVDLGSRGHIPRVGLVIGFWSPEDSSLETLIARGKDLNTTRQPKIGPFFRRISSYHSAIEKVQAARDLFDVWSDYLDAFVIL